jgi:uncharacterized protein (DUF305 family)
MTSLSKTLSVAVAAIAFAAPAAFAQQTGHDMKPMMQKNNEKMMSMPMTGKPDVDFAMSMREHHMGAIEMAQWQLDHGSYPKMKEMARKIIADQKKEIAQFDQFLARNGHKPGNSMGAGPSHSTK